MMARGGPRPPSPSPGRPSLRPLFDRWYAPNATSERPSQALAEAWPSRQLWHLRARLQSLYATPLLCTRTSSGDSGIFVAIQGKGAPCAFLHTEVAALIARAGVSQAGFARLSGLTPAKSTTGAAAAPPSRPGPPTSP